MKFTSLPLRKNLWVVTGEQVFRKVNNRNRKKTTLAFEDFGLRNLVVENSEKCNANKNIAFDSKLI